MTVVEMACKGKLEPGAPVYVDNDGIEDCEIIGSISTSRSLSGSSSSSGKLRRQKSITCAYCGRTYDKGQRKCWDGVDGCGSPLLE